ncbi:SDR family oxidoreductase [Mesorhizobium sp. ORM8.1]
MTSFSPLAKSRGSEVEISKVGILERMRLDGKIAFVTGGARGIGKAIVSALAEAGAQVAIVDLDLDEAKKSCAEISAANSSRMIAIKTDITDPRQVNAMIDRILEEFGHLDIAFCNAGISNEVAVEDDTYEDWKKIIEVNLNGTFLTAQAAGRVMLKQGGGSIVCTASMSAHIVNIPQREASYAASKAAVIQMSKAMAIEWATRNVRVNTISPGYMATEMTLKSPALRPLIEQWEQLSPLRRMGKPEELQSIAVYLAGDTSSFTTGADFIVDGAYTCF